MVKVCTKCKVEKPLTEFNKNKKTKDNYRSDCNYCRKQYYQANKERIKEYEKQYYQANKEKINEYEKQRRKTDHMFKLKKLLRDRSQKAFKRKGYSKNTKTQEMLGVDWEIAKQHIERQFKKGMNWENHGEWHIDHIIPLASAKTPERLKQLCHYTNLQPMWAVDNLSKSDSINGQQTLLRI
jgi:hypothetical protein